MHLPFAPILGPPLNVRDAYCVSSYKDFDNELNFNGIEFPVTLKSIVKFEKLNDISINVYGLTKWYGNFSVDPLHLTAEKREKNLLHVVDS